MAGKGLALIFGPKKGEKPPVDDDEGEGMGDDSETSDDEYSESDSKQIDEVADAMFDALQDNDKDAFRAALKRYSDLDQEWDKEE